MVLFLDGLFNSDTTGKMPPSAIKIIFPVINQQNGTTRRYDNIYGLLSNEVTVSSQVKWGTILNDVSSLQAVASLLSDKKMWTWIGASTMCWYGTEPIKTGFEFYLINYKRGMKLEEKLTNLNLLTSLVRADKFRVYVHGGYAAKILNTNTIMFNNGVEKQSEAENSNNSGLIASGLKKLEEFGETPDEKFDEGTISILIGNKLTLSQMLIQRLDVTPSTVEVVDGLPLYYRVSMTLTGARPLLSTQVEEMYRKM